jgi:hypothetical protein
MRGLKKNPVSSCSCCGRTAAVALDRTDLEKHHSWMRFSERSVSLEVAAVYAEFVNAREHARLQNWLSRNIIVAEHLTRNVHAPLLPHFLARYYLECDLPDAGYRR